jgi:hypothetical protein
LDSHSIARLAAAAFLLVLVACETETIEAPFEPPMATPQELVGPWRQFPLRLDPLVWAQIEEACRKDMLLAPGSRAVIIDARGAGVATVRMTGAMVGHCNALQITPRGDVVGAGGGYSGPGPERLEPLAPADLGPLEIQDVGGGNLTVTGWSAHGRAGDAIATVFVEPRGGPPVQATLMNGWYSAWWPTLSGAVGPGPGGPGGGGFGPPVVVRAYDAAGVLLEELMH